MNAPTAKETVIYVIQNMERKQSEINLDISKLENQIRVLKARQAELVKKQERAEKLHDRIDDCSISTEEVNAKLHNLFIF